jgi:hypothetical protein
VARRRWPYIVLGIAIVLVFVGIGAIIATVAWFQENMEVEASSNAEAEAEFDKIRQQFGGREPLLQMRDGVPHYTHPPGTTPKHAEGTTRLETLHVLVWDPEDERLARVALPFWLLRMKSDPIEFSAYASGLDEGGVDIRPEDIERYGAGVILDTGTSSRERVLLWAQ